MILCEINPLHTSRKEFDRIWITGSRGFIGIHLVPVLKDMCSELKCISNSTTKNSTSRHDYEIINIDFLNIESINKAIKMYGKPDLFIHLGWGSMTNPHAEEHLTSNVLASKNLISTLFDNGLNKFVFIGSMNEYGDRIGRLSEDVSSTGFLTNYAKGKSRVASYGFEKAYQTKKQFIHIRLFYTYGPVSGKGSLIQTLYLGGRKNLDTHLGACEHYRDYIHVSEVVKGIQLISGIQDSVTVNLGSGKSIKVKDFALLFWKLLDANPEKLHFGSKERHANEQAQPNSFADLNRLENITGWMPSLSIEDGIKSTIKSLDERS